MQAVMSHLQELKCIIVNIQGVFVPPPPPPPHTHTHIQIQTRKKHKLHEMCPLLFSVP